MITDSERIYQRIEKEYIDHLVGLTDRSSEYVSDRVHKRDTTKSRAKLEKSMSEVPILEGIDPHTFAIGLIKYLFSGRKK
jgi:hypothetical protein